MRTQTMIMTIVLAAFLMGVAAVVGVVWWLGAGLGAVVVVGALAVLAAIFFLVVRPWYLRWGATDEEVAMPMPGDELIPDTKPATRAIGIAARPNDIWPWLAQLGYGKAGWYSYDWIDNDGQPSADEIIAEYQTLKVGDRILMLENAIYSVISPEGCAAILWNDATQKERAAEALRLTARDLLALGVIDEIVPEPAGGAHADPDGTAEALGAALSKQIGELERLDPQERVRLRADKYHRMGRFTEQ